MNLGKHIAIIGSRSFSNYLQLKSYCDEILHRGDTIVSGGATGADSFAQRYARERGLQILIIYPDWVHDGKGAGFRRNKYIAEASNSLVAFYAKGKYQQGGTRNTVEWAERLGIPFVEIEEEQGVE